MPSHILQIKPAAIEEKSFAIIEDEFFRQTGRRPDDFAPGQFAVIQRVIHATGDFSFADLLLFHPDAITAALATLQAGRSIAADVNMLAAGINKTTLSGWGGEVLCKLSDPEIAPLAAQAGTTRSEMAIEAALEAKPGIIAIGNAPTALLKVMERLEEEPTDQPPDLIVGVPVGFVNAAESKEILAGKEYPFITCRGRKGGSPVAAAIVNALMKLALNAM